VWLQHPLSIPHPTAALTSIHASLPHFLPSPALASPVGSSSSQPGVGVNNAPCSTLFVANLGQFVSEHELKEIFSRCGSSHIILNNTSEMRCMIVQMADTESYLGVRLLCISRVYFENNLLLQPFFHKVMI
jgi:hypothetical protein